VTYEQNFQKLEYVYAFEVPNVSRTFQKREVREQLRPDHGHLISRNYNRLGLSSP
jgi:hypothetical protein